MEGWNRGLTILAVLIWLVMLAGAVAYAIY
jgi:hypothetical protein